MNKHEELPERIQRQLKEITRTSGLPDTRESLDQITANWIEKRQLFERQTRSLDMRTVDSFSREDPGGALMLTYSGSLIAVGTRPGGDRELEYASIKLRGDVPEIVKTGSVNLTEDIKVNQCAAFDSGPVRKTSEILIIARCRSDVNLEEQAKRIREATIFLTNGFVKINRALTINTKNQAYEQFNRKSIIGYLAREHGLSRSQIAGIIDDYLYIVECGLLLGERVSLGKLGHLSLKIRPAQQARIGRNPATGEPLTIKAKPETPVPRISFSKHIKEKAAALDVDQLAKTEE